MITTRAFTSKLQTLICEVFNERAAEPLGFPGSTFNVPFMADDFFRKMLILSNKKTDLFPFGRLIGA